MIHVRSRHAAWWLIAAFLLSLPVVTTRINASDEIQFFSWLHSWAFDRDADFDNEYRHFHDVGPGRNPGFIETFLDAQNEAGRRPNFAPIGSAVLWLPFYAAGHLAAGLSGSVTDGLSHPYIAAVTYGSAIYGLLSLLLSAAIVGRLIRGGGITAAVVVWLATPLLFYMYVAPAFSHACSAFAVALFLWTWLRVRERWSMAGAVGLGLAGALMAMVREQDLFFVAGPAVDFLRWSYFRLRPGAAGAAGPLTWPRVARRAMAGTVAFFAGYAPQLAAYQALNGHPSPTTTVARKMTWSSPHFLEVLFSPQHGLFFWTPLAALALVGLIVLCVRRPVATAASRDDALPAADVRWIAALLLLMVGLQVYVSGSVESWTVAGAFGQRRFVALTPILVVGIAALLPPPGAGPVRRWSCALVAVLAIWWNLGLMAQFGLHLMDRQRLSLADNARITFLELPRMAPSIIVRYLTDRESFYGRPRE